MKEPTPEQNDVYHKCFSWYHFQQRIDVYTDVITMLEYNDGECFAQIYDIPFRLDFVSKSFTVLFTRQEIIDMLTRKIQAYKEAQEEL